MGTTLTGTTPQDTYDSLIKVTDNGPLSGTAKYLSDGLGNDSALALSTSRVGVGNAAPAYKLDVTGDIRTSVASGNGSLYINNSSLTSKFWTFIPETAAGETNLLFFYGGTGAGTKMTLTNGGNVGIGTSAPAAKLDIFGAGNQAISGKGQLFIADGGTAAQAAGEGGQLSFGAWLNGDLSAPYPMATLKGISEVATTNQNQGALIIGTSDTNAAVVERVRITSENYLRLAAGGIQFNGDTAAANALDDYEEGTFAPTIEGSTSAGTATYSVQSGRYTKIGNQVSISIDVSWNSGTGTGNIRITGLPFTNVSNNNAASFGFVDGISLTALNILQGYVAPSSSRIDVVQTPTGGGAVSDVAYDAAGRLIVTATYFVS